MLGCPALTKKSSLFEVVNYVEWKNVQTYLSKVLKKFGRQDYQNLEEKIKLSIVDRNNKRLIDPGFVLRILLEIYRIEKKLKYDFLKGLLESKIQFENQTEEHFLSNFEEFREFVSSCFPYLTEVEFVKMYNNCFAIGNKKITFDLAYTWIRATLLTI